MIFSLLKGKGAKAQMRVASQIYCRMNRRRKLIMCPLKDMTGLKFGKLTVLERAEDHVQENGRRRVQWLCQCECGNQCLVLGENLRKGNTLSCGCHQKEMASKANTTHGLTDSRLYVIWSSIRLRCYNKNNPQFKNYGERGIIMCPEWKDDFQAFHDWAFASGYDEKAPRGVCTIDRIDVNGIYSPENCRWVTAKEQMNNVRYNVRYEYNGESHTCSEWSEITGVSAEKIRNRIKTLNWPVERAIFTL